MFYKSPHLVRQSTSNRSAAKAFCAELFGWTFDDLSVELGYHTVAFAKGISAAAVAPGMPKPDAATVTRTAYFGVIDADAIVGRVVANGGSMMVSPTTIAPFSAARRSRSTPTARCSVRGSTAPLRAPAPRRKMAQWPDRKGAAIKPSPTPPSTPQSSV